MIRQDQRTTGRSNSGRQAPAAQRNYSRIPIVSDVIDMFSGGGGQPEMQTSTQQNLPSWAIPDAMSTLSMGNYYTQTPDYRASTLDRDYSGLRGYDQTGLPNSQVGQFGLNPMGYTRPLLPDPSSNSTTERQSNQSANLDNLVAQLPPDLQSPLNLGRGRGRSAGWEWDDGGNTGYSGSQEASSSSSSSTPYDEYDSGYDIISPPAETPNYYSSDTYDGSFADTTSGDSGYDEYDSGYDITSPPAVDGGLEFSNEDSWVWGSGNNGNSSNNTSSENQDSNTNTQTNTTPTTQPTIDPRVIFNPDNLTPFQAYDRQRFAAPSQNTLRGEGILAGRYDQRFGPSGTDPFAAATTAVNKAANYGSTYTGTTGVDPTTGLTRIGSQTPGYRGSLAEQAAPTVFESENYTSQFLNTDGSPKSFFGAPNQGLSSTNFSNANSGLTAAKNYDKNFETLVTQSMNPYQDQVVNQTISDLNRARRISENDIRGQAAKAGAFGSREELLRAENNRNYLDRVAAATGQLRQQGFESAANRASQENLQRLGLTAQDLQQTRGLQSQGNLAAQNLTAQDAQNVRGLQAQGNLAALRENAGLFQSALGLNAAGDRSAMGYNAGLLSDAMRLDASDLNQRRNLASNEAQFAETANRGAGALNLQGGTALGQLAQAGTADERQRIADMLASGQAQTGRNQQDLDFIYNEFNRELAYPGQQIDLRNAAISPATGSIVTTTQPRYQQNPLLAGLGAGIGTYALAGNPYLAGAAGLLSYLNS